MKKYKNFYVPEATITREELAQALKMSVEISCAIKNARLCINPAIVVEDCEPIDCQKCLYYGRNKELLINYLK